MNTKQNTSERRAQRVRAKIAGTKDRPRLSVFRSNTTMYAQIINDDNHKTIAARSVKKTNMESAKALGKKIASAAKAKKVTAVVFDRGAHKYHGTIAALADAARAEGLVF